MIPPAHWNPPPRFGLRVQYGPNCALYRGGEFVAYVYIDPTSSVGRALDRPYWLPSLGGSIVHANELPPPDGP